MIETILTDLESAGYKVTKTRTVHATNATFYKIEKDGVTYPKRQDVGSNSILTAYEKYGLDGVLYLFK